MSNILYEIMTELPLQTASMNSVGAKEQISQFNMNKRFHISSVSDKGKGKEENQDSLLIKYGATALGHCVLAVVADGLGGCYKGELASSAAINKLEKWWNVNLKIIAYRSDYNIHYLIKESLRAVISEINLEIYEMGLDAGNGMGTTLSILFMLDDWYCIQHVGDSRVYKLSDEFLQLTEDDNLLERHIKSGAGIDKAGDCSILANTLTKCLGIKPNIEVMEQCGALEEKDSFMLCTDGFYKRISIDELQWFLNKCKKGAESNTEFLRHMVQKVRKRGEHDDISVIVITRGKQQRGFWHKIKGSESWR